MKNILWIDMEMSGLDETCHKVLEIAALVTNTAWEKLDEYHAVVYQPASVLEEMDDWCKKTHGDSGLTKAVASGRPLAEVEKDLLDLVARHFSDREQAVIAGNSIWNDRRFIRAYLPDFEKRLHYRMIDVSSFKEVFREKYGVMFKKGNAHRAMDDIEESIEELKLYLSYVKVGEGAGTQKK